MVRVRLLVMALYIGYLVQVGLLMTYLPWSPAWELLLLRLPPAIGFILDSPAIRGLISGFGVLHLGVVVLELLGAAPAPRRHSEPPSNEPPAKTTPEEPTRS